MKRLLAIVLKSQKTDGNDLKHKTLDFNFNIFSYWLFQNGQEH